ncbi:hypothetical protein GCM10017786_50120 [Amycolatopsis deserti]|uniref:AbiTii domain-containing protein n=1 Tax=Amycolatopsis deserti TaxID=185696 RepID=A0ABQ3JCH2_9PSEU|nr:hypothetical protein [Amycolatopsis deserti]GHF10424.1 hypothetical protein GCM10017786_50120 [Amycolatopsis deserti]
MRIVSVPPITLFNMSGRRDGLLADIEAGIIDGTSLTTLLQKCIILGGRSGSEKLREWARRELNGYAGQEPPNYRKVAAPIFARVTNAAGYHGFSQQLFLNDLSEQIQNFLREQKVDWEQIPLDSSVGDLEAMIARAEDNSVKLSPAWAGHMVEILNHANTSPNTRVATLYWEVPVSGIEGTLTRIRTALTELVSELISRTPEGQEVPAKGAADQAIQFVINGDRSVINYSPQQAGEGGKNTVNFGMAKEDEPKKEGWFARWRNRGIAVSIATVLGLGVAIATWLDWTPW